MSTFIQTAESITPEIYASLKQALELGTRGDDAAAGLQFLESAERKALNDWAASGTLLMALVFNHRADIQRDIHFGKQPVKAAEDPWHHIFGGGDYT